MNKQRRQVLHSVLDKLERLKDKIPREEAIGILKEAQQQTETVLDEEEAVLDNLPENLQFASRTTDIEDNVADLYDANDELEIAVDSLEGLENLEGLDTYTPIKSCVVSAVKSINKAILR